MNCFVRTMSLLRLEFHRSRVLHYRQQGRKLMRDGGVWPQLLALNTQIDHHGRIMYQLEHQLEVA